MSLRLHECYAKGWNSCPLIHVHGHSTTIPLIELGSGYGSICFEGVFVDPSHRGPI
jgi:hypothetical protein